MDWGIKETSSFMPKAVTARLQKQMDETKAESVQLKTEFDKAKAVAADFLGEDPESLSDRQSTEVTLELANMICGAVLSRIESSATFRLGTPQIETGDTGRRGPAEETRYTVDTGNGTAPVHARFRAASARTILPPS